MRILLLFFIVINLFAKETCYSISFFSSYKKPSNSLIKKYPKESVLMKIHNVYSLRYKCIDNYNDIKKIYREISKKYRHSIITKTYKFRFKNKLNNVKNLTYNNTYNNIKKSIKLHKKYKYKSRDSEELKLLFKTFVYKQNLKSALKIAKIGLKKNPNSYYWNENIANVLNWLGKSKESLPYLQKAYHIRHSAKLKKKILKLMILSGDPNILIPILEKRLKKRFNIKDFKELLALYYKIDDKKKIIKLIDNNYKYIKNNKKYIKIALQLALDMNDVQTAQKFIKLLEYTRYSIDEANLIASYYFKLGNIKKAFEVLINTPIKKYSQKESLITYYKNISDLGWYLKEKKISANASLKLINLGINREVDYIRVADVYKKDDDEWIKNIYLKFKKPNLFFKYAYTALKNKKYLELEHFMNSIKDKNIINNIQYYYIKLELYKALKEKDKVKKILVKILKYSPDDENVIKSLIWTFMNNKDVYDLKTIMLRYNNPTKNLYFEYASAYLFLKNIDLASKYAMKIINFNLPIKNSDDFKFLLAYIYKAQLKNGAYKQIIYNLYYKYLRELNQNFSNMRNPKFAYTYLRLAFQVLSRDQFLYLLKKYGNFLNEDDYEELYYSYLSKYSISAATLFLRYMRKKKLWMMFNAAINSNNEEQLYYLLNTYLYVLSRGDVIVQLKKRGDIARVQTLNFNSFARNTFNENMYNQHRDLSKKRTNLFESKISYISYDDLTQKETFIKDRRYFHNGFYYTLKAYKSYNKNKNEELFKETPNVTSCSLAVEKKFKRYKNKTTISLNKNKTSFVGIDIDNKYRLSNRVNLGLKLSKNGITKDDTILFLSGKKDYIRPMFQFNILPSLYFISNYTLARYSSSDDQYFGYGKMLNTSLSKIFTDEYPNITATLFFRSGKFSTSLSKGSAKEILNEEASVLPGPFRQYGITLNYGNDDIYTGIWRKFFNTSLIYSAIDENFAYSLNFGYAGRFLYKDHLTMGINFSSGSDSSIYSKVFELYLDYKFLSK
jgi:hypothetical protein